MTEVLISIIIPLKNAEEYLEQCVNSVLAQTYSDFECILIDDGSTDSSMAICEKLTAADPRIRILRNSGQGCSAARNTGMDTAKGEYIAFIDADDIIMPDYLEKLAALLQAFPECDIAGCSFQMIDSYGNPHSAEEENAHMLAAEAQETVISAEKVLRGIVTSGSPMNWQMIPVWNKLYRRSLLTDLRFRNGMIHEDEFFATELYVRLYAKSGTMIYTEKKLYCYRQHRTSVMHNIDPAYCRQRRLMAAAAFSERADVYYQQIPGLLEEAMHYLLQRCGLYCKEVSYEADGISVRKQRKEIWHLFKKQFRKYRRRLSRKERAKEMLFICMPVLYGRAATRKT